MPKTQLATIFCSEVVVRRRWTVVVDLQSRLMLQLVQLAFTVSLFCPALPRDVPSRSTGLTDSDL